VKRSILETVHDAAKGLHDIGLMDLQTMREFDALCLPPVRKLSPAEIRQIRLRARMSQPVFAKYINASPATIKKWEQGEKRPTGPALKLLNLIAEKGLAVLTEL
jgi:putative transcriptional regulator